MNNIKEPEISHILLCGHFNKRETKRIISAYGRAFKLLNMSILLKEEKE